MMSPNKLNVFFKAQRFILLFALVSIYLLYGTGPASDDYMNLSLDWGLFPTGIVQTLPLQHYTHYLLYTFLSPSSIVGFSLLKAVYVILSLLLLDAFLALYTTQKAPRALAAFLLIFLPCHDVPAFWFICQHMLLSMAILLYAYACMIQERSWLYITLLLLIGSFMSYGSPTVVAALACMCMYRKRYKLLYCLLGVHSIYVLYYVMVTRSADVTSRLPLSFSLLTQLKQLLLQFGTWGDAVLGPSMWLKVVFSIMSLTMLSLLAFITVVAVYLYFSTTKQNTVSNSAGLDSASRNELWVGAGAAVLASLVMFSVTGAYPHLAFNLGNRTSLYSSAILVALLFLPTGLRYLRISLIAVMVLAIFGLSDYWREMTRNQLQVVNHMLANKELQLAAKTGTVFVIGNAYTKLGPMDHIEFMSEDWVPHGILSWNDADMPENIHSLDLRYSLQENELVNNKHGGAVDLQGPLYLYDSRNDVLKTIKAEELPVVAEKEGRPLRHWIFLLQDTLLHKLLVTLMPRLKYALNENK